jgi:cation transport ATPase
MHREVSHSDQGFHQESRLSLYLLTALLALLLVADLWPAVARWVADWGPALPTWGNEVSRYRIALLAAVLGGARTLNASLDALFAGRVGADLALAIACVAAILVCCRSSPPRSLRLIAALGVAAPFAPSPANWVQMVRQVKLHREHA